MLPEIVVLYCGRTLGAGAYLPEGWTEHAAFKDRFICIPCASKIEPLYLFRLFEHGADAVLVVACPQDRCQFLFGNAGIEPRLKYASKLLEEVGIGPGRISLVVKSDLSAADLGSLAGEAAASVSHLGANPVKKLLAEAH